MTLNNIDFKVANSDEIYKLALVMERAKAKRDLLDAPTEPSKQTLEDVQTRLDRIGAKAHVAVYDGETVGFVLSHPLVELEKTVENTDTQHLALLMVDPEHWGKRIASKLIDQTMEQARQSGKHYVTLWTNELDNERARAVYEHKGFKLTGAHKVGQEGKQVHYQADL
jgi:GNAT superfamily N-acetyltransferase